jgi:hypothetical protein
MDKLPPKSAKALHKEATQARPGRSKPANLRDQVSNMQNWPTPLSTEYRANRVRRENHHNGLTQAVLATQDGGQLNQMWVEWLMGWPIGWTDLKPLEMDKCLYARLLPGEFSQETNDGNK